MPLFGPHRAFEIPGTPGFNPQAEDPRLRRRSVYSFPEERAQVPPVGEVARAPQAASPALDAVIGERDRYPILTRMEQHNVSEPTRAQHRPSTGRTVGAAAIGAINAYLNPGQGVGAEAMTNIMEAPYRKAHGEWERQAGMMTASHEMNKVRRGYEQADAEERRKQGLFKLDMQIKAKQLEKATTPEEERRQRAEAIEAYWPDAPPEIKNRFILGGKFPPAQRPSTAGVGRTVVVGGRVIQFNEVTGRYDIDLGAAPQRPSARQLSDEREVDVVEFARGALENANGDAQTAVQDVGWLVDQKLIPAELFDDIIRHIRLQVRPIPGQGGTGFSSEFGLGR